MTPEIGAGGEKQVARKYFGTDGVRGRVGTHPMTVDFALRLASAAARVLVPEGGGSVLIGKDTRVSGYLFESALEAGFVAAGVVGVISTSGGECGPFIAVEQAVLTDSVQALHAQEAAAALAACECLAAW